MRITLFLGIAIFLQVQAVWSQTFDTDLDKQPSLLLIERLDPSFGAAPSSLSPRPLLPVIVAMIKHFEGWVPNPYNDAAGFCTIGYGHLLAESREVRRCEDIDLGVFAQGIDLKKGEDLLLEDTVEARLAVQSLTTGIELDPHQFGALSSFVFNVGQGNFAKSTMLRMLRRNEPELAEMEFSRWVLAGGKVLPGLVARRACEAAAFRGDVELNAGGDFDRSLCRSLGIAANVSDLIDLEIGEEVQ